MADKQAVFTLRVDTGNSVQDVQNFDQAVQNLNKDLKETQTTASQQTGMDQFEAKLQELNERLEAGGLSMRDMTKLMKEYQTLAAQAGQTSPVGQQAIENAGELKDTIGDLRAATTALASDTVKLDTALAGIETGAAAFQGVQSAIALTGVESTALTETMVRLQAAQGLVNAVQTIANKLQKDSILMLQLRNLQEKGLGKSILQNSIFQKANNLATITATAVTKLFGGAVNQTSIGFKLLKGAIISTGIGALVVVIGSLISKMGDWISSEKELKAAAEARQAALDASILGIERESELAQARAELQGKSQAQILEIQRQGLEKKAKELANAANEEYRIYEKLYADDWGGINDETKAAYDKHVELMKQQNETVHQLNLLNVQIQKQAQDDVKANRDKALEDEKKSNEQAAKLAKERADKAKQQRKELIDILRARFEDQIKLQDQYNALVLQVSADGQEKELKQAQENFNKFKRDFLDERIKDETNALNKQFENGKISRKKYEEDLAKLRTNALNKLTVQEKAIVTVAETALLQEQQKIRDKFAAEELAKQAEQEAKKIELRKKFNLLIADEFENERLQAVESNQEQLKDVEEALKAGVITQGEAHIARIKLANDLADKEKEITDKKNEYIKEQEKKAREEQLKGITKVIEGAQKGLDGLKQVNELVNEIDQARLNSLAKNREEDLANLDANLQAQLNQEGLTADQRTAIEQKFAQQKYNVQLKAFEQEEKIKKAQFNREKALRLAQVGIDTASAIVKGIAQFGPPPSPAGIAAIASASLIGITQAMAIMNQQYQAGSAPSPPQLGAGGSAGNLTGASASTFTANTNAQTTDLTTLGQGQGQNIPVSQVVVLESDITGTQNKVKLQEAKTSF
jgi:hypothetical protein